MPKDGDKAGERENRPQRKTKKMPRITKPAIDFSDECMEAFDRLVALAHRLSATLTGDALSPETGECATPRSAAMTMAMVYFLIRADRDDLKTLFFSENSLDRIPFSPFAAPQMRHAPLARLLRP